MSSGRTAVGVVLTGGASSRMGTDKAFVVVDGAPMVVRVADALWEAGCHPVECQGGDVDRISALGLSAIPDMTPGAGPVSAIREALRRNHGPIVVAACDLADLDAATVRSVIDVGQHAAVAVAESDGHHHLLSYWSIGSAELLDEALGEGRSAYSDVLDRLGATAVPVSSAAMRNVNRPDDVG